MEDNSQIEKMGTQKFYSLTILNAIMLATMLIKRDILLPLMSFDLSVVTCLTEEGSDIVILPEMEPLSIN